MYNSCINCNEPTDNSYKNKVKLQKAVTERKYELGIK
jgi:hypothetical protein